MRKEVAMNKENLALLQTISIAHCYVLFSNDQSLGTRLSEISAVTDFTLQLATNILQYIVFANRCL